MKLSLVIPVWNDAARLERLLRQVPDLGIFSEVIVVDDNSDPPCAPESMGLTAARLGSCLTYVRTTAQHGAGHARNLGLDQVTGSHVLFFDSDDLFTPGIRDIVAPLQDQDFDFCIFRHVDSRVREAGGYGPLAADQRFWDAVGAGALPAPLSPRGMTELCSIAAYPWNKIYRTGFLHENNIRCTEIPVHNDVELHWMSFMRADRILATTLVGCEHFVHPEGQRLTNRTGHERLQVFKALEALHEELDRNPRRIDFIEPFIEFYTGLFGWITETLEPDLRGAFFVQVRNFLLRRMSVPLFTLVALRNPALGGRINRILSGPPT